MLRPTSKPGRPLAGAEQSANAQRGGPAAAVPPSTGAGNDLLCDAAVYRVAGTGIAPDYTAGLIASLGGRVERTPGRRASSAGIAWARSGAMALTGPADGPPRLVLPPLASGADGAACAVALLAADRWTGGPVDGAALLGERAAIAGFHRRGAISPGGACRMLRAADGWIALNLARPDDIALLPAWLGDDVAREPWSFAAERAALRPTDELIARARLLGLPVAAVTAPCSSAPPWLRVAARGAGVDRGGSETPLAIDLSSLWAGPLCTQLLVRAGVRVVKVESTRRPDGGRFGPAAFFDLLNAGKASVSIDFSSERGRERLRRLIARADIVVESSRPRALEQLGVHAADAILETPGLTWVSITGYGRRAPCSNWVAFGDDAGVAAGLAVASASAGGPPEFCGDAIADPLTGLHAAAAALASWRGGGGHLLDLALRDVAAHVAAVATPDSDACIRATQEGWEVVEEDARCPVALPRARRAAVAARPLGADTTAVLAELGIPC